MASVTGKRGKGKENGLEAAEASAQSLLHGQEYNGGARHDTPCPSS